jgi:tRNA(Ile)-lysidine synthase
MASSGKPTSSDALEERVAGELAAVLFPGAHLLAGLSGGVDSVSLLFVLARLAEAMRFSLRAVHVHHGISPHADRWQSFCEDYTRRLGIRLQVERVDISGWRHLGLEGAARAARYDAFARHDADFLVLAQHRDDQAETFLLQLMRGAGVAGLAGMPLLREGASRPGRHRIIRPLLGSTRADIESYARRNDLRWVEDESNADQALQRNFIRGRALPLLEERYPHARASINRSAAHLREAARVLDEIGRADVESADTGDGLDVAALRSIGHARAKNLLRVYCREAGCPVPGGAVLEELWQQLTTARDDARPRIEVGDWLFRRYRNRLYLERRRQRPDPAFSAVWDGDNALPLLELGGVLRFRPEEGRGVSIERLRSAPVTVRMRRGGEKLRLHPDRPHRTLKNLFQESGLPPWRRESLPLVYCGDELVAVPGIGEALPWRAGRAERGLIITWEAL